MNPARQGWYCEHFSENSVSAASESRAAFLSLTALYRGVLRSIVRRISECPR